MNSANGQKYPTSLLSSAVSGNKQQQNAAIIATLPTNPLQSCLQKRPHLTNEERLDIINRLKRNESGARIARDYGITKQAVSAIKRRAQLMGDNFYSKYYTTQRVAGVSSAGSRNQSPTLLNYSKSTHCQMSTKGNNKNSLTINIATPIVSVLDNSLVSRQLKQQKVNATIMKQSNLLAQLPRSTSDLVLPVNPVAIIKSQIAAQQQQNSLKTNSTNSTTKNVENKLILPRLLQGTETYTPIYVSFRPDGNNAEINNNNTADDNIVNYEKDRNDVQSDSIENEDDCQIISGEELDQEEVMEEVQPISNDKQNEEIHHLHSDEDQPKNEIEEIDLNSSEELQNEDDDCQINSSEEPDQNIDLIDEIEDDEINSNDNRNKEEIHQVNLHSDEDQQNDDDECHLNLSNNDNDQMSIKSDCSNQNKPLKNENLTNDENSEECLENITNENNIYEINENCDGKIIEDGIELKQTKESACKEIGNYLAALPLKETIDNENNHDDLPSKTQSP